MENSGNTPVGVGLHIYECTILRVHHIRLFKPLCKRILDNIAARCTKSGWCISDLYPQAVAEHTDVGKLDVLADICLQKRLTSQVHQISLLMIIRLEVSAS